jgi:hypothetical protein
MESKGKEKFVQLLPYMMYMNLKCDPHIYQAVFCTLHIYQNEENRKLSLVKKETGIFSSFQTDFKLYGPKL